MKVGITLSGVPLAQKPVYARRAQDAGLDSVWTDDNPGGDAIVALAAMAAAAPRIRVGSGILRAFTRHPVSIASSFANLAALSEAGAILGFGTGTYKQNLFQYGMDVPKPVTRLRSVIGMVRGVWESAAAARPFRWQDEFYNVSDVRASGEASAVTAVPVFVAAVNERMLRFTGAVADGLAGHPVCSARYTREVVRPTIQTARQAANNPAPFELAAWVMAVVDDDRDRARLQAARQIAFYLSTRTYFPLLEFYGCGQLAEPLRDAVLKRNDIDAAAALIPTAVVDEVAVTGTRDEVQKQLERYEGVADSIVLASAGTGATVAERLEDVAALIGIGGQLMRLNHV